jgi:uncharacterized membrane protein YeaQ/YmgE (transglycosylase-associated protein family)
MRSVDAWTMPFAGTSIAIALFVGRMEVAMDILWTVVIGGIVGWLASLAMRTDGQMGIVANVVVGIVGSVLGHVAAGALGIDAGNAALRWLVSLLGAIVLIALLSALGVFRGGRTRVA